MRNKIALLMAFTVLCGFCAAAAAAAKEPKYDFDLDELTSGETTSMAELCSDKPLVVVVWEPECPHCKRHMPYVAALYKKLDPEDAEFVSISVGDNRRLTESYVADKELEFPVLFAPSGELTASFLDRGWPTTFVFDKGGKLVGIVDASGPSYITEVLDIVARYQ